MFPDLNDDVTSVGEVNHQLEMPIFEEDSSDNEEEDEGGGEDDDWGPGDDAPVNPMGGEPIHVTVREEA